MSRRKQPNPAKLGDSENREDDKTPNPKICSSIVEALKNGLGETRDTDEEENKYSEEQNDIDNDSLGSVCTEHESWGSNTPDRASPAPSSCPTPNSSLSDIAESDLAFTVGITETTPYACKICNKAFARSSLLSKHEQSHTDQLQYGCSYCPRLFKHKRSRDRHIKLHTGDKKYKCVHCQTAFSRSDHLKIHMKTHDNSKPFRCLICNRGYNTAAALTSHQQSHSKQNLEGNSDTFKCSRCLQVFDGCDQLGVHVSTFHNTVLMDSKADNSPIELTKWVCMYCGKDFLIIEEMRSHINADHGALVNGNFLPSPKVETFNKDSSLSEQSDGTPTYACDSCTMHFDSVDKLRGHENCVHWKPPQPLATPSKTFIKDCDTCLISAPSINPSPEPSSNMQPIQLQPTDLSRKRKIEDDKMSPKRNNVGTSCVASASCESPKKEEWTSYICSICGTQLPNFASFMVHMDIHMSVNATPTNTVLGGYCPLCGEAYRDQTELNNHIVLHTLTYKPGWCCRVCKKFFDDNLEDFQRHLLEKHSCTTYKCGVCEQLFENKTSMLMHLTKKHSNECQHYRCKFCPEQIFHNQLSAEMHISQHIPRLFNPSPKPSYSFPSSDFRLGSTIKSLQCPFCRQCFKGEYLQQMHILKDHKDYLEARGSRVIDDCSSSVEQISSRGAAISPTIPYAAALPLSEKLTRYEKTLIDNIVCDICGSSDFGTNAELTSHKKLHHVKAKIGPVSLQCAYCNEHCKSRSDLENHMKNHQINSGKGKHKCNICDEIYSSAITLAEHKLSHCKIISGDTCTQCKTVLSDEQTFYSHQLQHSVTALSKSNSQISLPANCIVCCQTLQTDLEIKLHANFHLRHIVQKEYLCNVCNRLFDTRTGITVSNLDKNSENLKISVCHECIDKCGNNGTSASPKTNVKIENADKKLFSFENEIDVKQHSVGHSSSDASNHECHICRSIFSSASKLQLHVIEHSFFGTGQFRCYICSSVFTTANGLLSHMLEHGPNSKPYECATCQTKFFFQTELDNHKYEHILSRAVARSINLNNLDEFDYKDRDLTKCPYCDTSTSRTYLHLHIRFCSQNPHANKKVNQFLENPHSEIEDKSV